MLFRVGRNSYFLFDINALASFERYGAMASNGYLITSSKMPGLIASRLQKNVLPEPFPFHHFTTPERVNRHNYGNFIHSGR